MSALRVALAKYLAVRRALGTQLRDAAVTLSHFVEFLEAEGAEYVTTQLALRWARKPEHAQPATWAGRLTMVRQFAAWLSATDTRTEVPPRRILEGRRRRKTPYIFSEQEIARLMAEAARLPSPTGLRALTYVTLIGLLASTGLRPGEALGLDEPDVDLQNGVLAIRQTKFGKSRFVPVEDSTRVALAHYAAQRDRLCRLRQTSAFLVCEHGTRLRGAIARQTFGRMSCSIGLRAAAGARRVGRGPRLRDFRHSFATKRLVEWYRAGMDVERELPKLSTYLGHVQTADTYWYIQAVPELLQLATERLCSREPGGPR
jgi:integrase